MGKHKNGRPPAVEITDVHIEQIMKLAGYGLSVAQIAAIIGMSRSVFYDYMSRDERIKSAYEQGKAIARMSVSKALFEKAIEGDMRAIQWYEMTRCGITPDKPIKEDIPNEGADLSLLEDDELETLHRIISKANTKDDAIDAEFEEEKE